MTPDPARSDIMPASVRRLPRDRRGYPVPWFIEWIDGVPDFRIMDARKLNRIIRGERSCWICGGKLSSRSSYVIGPMCAVNRTTAEPPSHPECALYAVKVCPFLTTPRRSRQDGDHRPLPEGAKGNVAGVMLERNPGVALIWTIKGRPLTRRAPNGILFNIGTPVELSWWAHGRPATREEILESIDSGMPALRAYCYTPTDVAALSAEYSRAMRLLPAA